MKSRLVLPALCLFLPFGLASCAGSDSSASDTVAVAVASDTTTAVETGAGSAGENAAAGGGGGRRGAFSAEALQCFEENGVTLPEGGLGAGAGGGGLPVLPDGVDPAALQKAFSACGSALPAGLPGGAGGADGGPDLSAFTTCLRDNGVSIADDAKLTDLPTTDPAFVAASATCAPLLPAAPVAGAAPTTEG